MACIQLCLLLYVLVEDQWNRLNPTERAEKEAFVAGERSVTKSFMRMVCTYVFRS